MQQLKLNNNWKLHEAPLHYERNDLAKVKAFSDGWLDCSLPTDVRMPLIEKGIIKDPVKSDYCLESEWVEHRSWWFCKSFTLEGIDLDNDVIELSLERLDTRSDIFLNDVYLGSHCDVHFPFKKDVKAVLKEGINEICVRVSTGLEEISDEELSEIDWAVCTEYDNGGKYRGDKRRSFVRRPQYTVGWDWGPRVVTCGITGDVQLQGYKNIAIRDISVVTKTIAAPALLDVTVNIEDLDIIGSKICDLHVDLSINGKLCSSSTEKSVLLTSGTNYIETSLQVENPQLWWPNGYGQQPLYTVSIYADCEGSTEQWPEFSYGIRTVTLDTSPIDGENRKFTFVVNNVPIFAKGGDWIPNDSIYARTTQKKVTQLLDEAINANFNSIRIWGGGLYETDFFYETCDKLGILLWHDFMFACSTYPDHQEWFRNLAAAEMDYQTKRLRNHACIGLFCGTNENHWLFNKIDTPKWGIEITHNHSYGLSIPNIIAKEVMHNNCPHIPYWNSSPYGGKLPNDDTIGDVHRWRDAFMSSKMEERVDLLAYDDIKSKFVSEYGYVGPCSMQTMRDYLDLKPDESIIRQGRPWEMHLNVFEKETVYAGIEKHYVDRADKLSIEDYLLYGGMVHGSVLGYSLEAIRFKDFCSGGIFWMYNDTWGEVGWTIIDYYLRRKISFYGVKRALAHKKVSIRKVNDEIVVQGMNDGAVPLDFKAEYGYVSFDGAIRDTRMVDFHLDPHERAYLLTEKAPDFDETKGTIVVIPDSEEIDPVMLITLENRNLDYVLSSVEILSQTQKDNNALVTVTSKGYAHGVYVEGDYKCSDNYFDLLPGQVKTICIENAFATDITVKQVR
ncbi:MAG: beta-mannosidase [Lachnospiraceae bacterium]|nr:beta-mannosidase [Lachnospiraceae bacterium]